MGSFLSADSDRAVAVPPAPSAIGEASRAHGCPLLLLPVMSPTAATKLSEGPNQALEPEPGLGSFGGKDYTVS